MPVFPTRSKQGGSRLVRARMAGRASETIREGFSFVYGKKVVFQGESLSCVLVCLLSEKEAVIQISLGIVEHLEVDHRSRVSEK